MKKNNFLKYKKKLTIEENIFEWLNKLHSRGNFSFELGEECYGTMPEQFRASVGNANEGFYGDQDKLYSFKAESWDPVFGDNLSPRNVKIEGYMPLHISYNGKPEFGWCWNRSSTPDSLIFTFILDGETEEIVTFKELLSIQIPYDKNGHKWSKYRDKLEKFLLDLFYLCHFRQKAGIPTVDNR